MPPLLFEYNLSVGRRLLVPKLTDVLFLAVFLASVMLGSRMLNTDGDLGRDLTLGNYTISAHIIPLNDILSWSRVGQPRPPYEWLAQVMLAAVGRVLGLDGIVLLVSIVIAAAFAVVCSDALERSGMPLASLLISGWAAIASSLHWLARPHVFSFLFLAIWLRGMERVRHDSAARLWEMPALMLVWANTHGGFVFGFAAWLAYFVGWLWEARTQQADRAAGRRLLITGVASLVASMLTPDLWNNWAGVLANRSSYILSQTAETRPPQLSMPAVWPFLILVFLTVLLGLLNARRLRADHVLLMGGLLVTSALMARNIPLFAIAAAPILAYWLAGVLEERVAWRRWERGFAELQSSLVGIAWPLAMILAVGAVLLIHRNATHSSVFRFEPTTFPVQAADWIQENRPQGPMFNDFNWGGYLLYRLWPGERVYIDSQSDFYGEQLMREYANVLGAGPGWEGMLDKYAIGWVVIPPSAPLAAQLGLSPEWVAAYSDTTADIFVRSAP